MVPVRVAVCALRRRIAPGIGAIIDVHVVAFAMPVTVTRIVLCHRKFQGGLSVNCSRNAIAENRGGGIEGHHTIRQIHADADAIGACDIAAGVDITRSDVNTAAIRDRHNACQGVNASQKEQPDEHE